VGDAAGKFDHLDAAPHVAAGLVERLAVFPRHEPGEFVEMLLEQVAVAEEDRRPLRRRHRAPGGERGPRRLHGGIDVGRGAEGHPRDHLAGGRIENVAMLFGGDDRLTGDQVRSVHRGPSGRRVYMDRVRCAIDGRFIGQSAFEG
jgi:hypothetical protein